MMPAYRRTALVLLACACVAGAAEPTLLNYVMPDARVVAGANVSQFVTSPLIRQFPQLRDVAEVLFASPGNPKESRGLLLARGVFDPSKMGALPVTFLDSTTIVMGDPLSVQNLIDHRGPGPDQKLRARINQLSGKYDVWALSTIPPSSLPAPASSGQFGGIMQGDIMRGILETSGGLKFGAEVMIEAEVVTRSEKDATALADVVRFLVGLTRVEVQKLDLKTQGNLMRLSLPVPEAELGKIIQQALATAKQR